VALDARAVALDAVGVDHRVHDARGRVHHRLARGDVAEVADEGDADVVGVGASGVCAGLVLVAALVHLTVLPDEEVVADVAPASRIDVVRLNLPDARGHAHGVVVGRVRVVDRQLVGRVAAAAVALARAPLAARDGDAIGGEGLLGLSHRLDVEAALARRLGIHEVLDELDGHEAQLGLHRRTEADLGAGRREGRVDVRVMRDAILIGQGHRQPVAPQLTVVRKARLDIDHAEGVEADADAAERDVTVQPRRHPPAVLGRGQLIEQPARLGDEGGAVIAVLLGERLLFHLASDRQQEERGGEKTEGN
jgi:hypothetical protein